MSDEHDATVDDSRNGQQLEDSTRLHGVEKTDGKECNSSKKSRSDYEQEAPPSDIKQAVLDAIPDDELLDMLAEYREQRITQWSGELSDPESFSKYPPDVQQAMVQWNNARTIDESRRQDRLVDAIIEESKRENWQTFVLSLVFAAFAFIAFIVTGSAWSYGMLAVPGASIVVNFVRNHRKND